MYIRIFDEIVCHYCELAILSIFLHVLRVLLLPFVRPQSIKLTTFCKNSDVISLDLNRLCCVHRDLPSSLVIPFLRYLESSFILCLSCFSFLMEPMNFSYSSASISRANSLYLPLRSRSSFVNLRFRAVNLSLIR